ncbi:MAG: hypothetical protein PHV34_01820 [Verrucomicrobiae bacterium]|nr:hypothetical protein [Verrucomicrobiae bacterium]
MINRSQFGLANLDVSEMTDDPAHQWRIQKAIRQASDALEKVISAAGYFHYSANADDETAVVDNPSRKQAEIVDTPQCV